jgi:hypothetical protein
MSDNQQRLVSHVVTLWMDGEMWQSGFLTEPSGEISLYASSKFSMGQTFDANSLPSRVKVCPSLTLRHDFAPPEARARTAEIIRRYGYELFEVDVLPWD